MAWVRLATKTLTSAGANISTDAFTGNTFNQILSHTFASTSAARDLTFNNSSAPVYAVKRSYNGGQDTPEPSQSFAELRFNSNEDHLHIIYTCWVSSQEKLAVCHFVSGGTLGAGNPPNRTEVVFKYVPSPDESLTNVKFNKGSFVNFDTNSNLMVIGSDGTPSVVTWQNGLEFHETDTNKDYVWNSSTSAWIQIT